MKKEVKALLLKRNRCLSEILALAQKEPSYPQKDASLEEIQQFASTFTKHNNELVKEAAEIEKALVSQATPAEIEQVDLFFQRS